MLYNGDQVTLGVRSLKRFNPELFSRDYAYGNYDWFKFYTPSFLIITGWLTKLTGTFDYALVTLIPITAMIYMIGMFIFIYYMTENVLIAFLIAILSAIPRYLSMVSFWGVMGSSSMMPRTMFLMFAPYLFCLMFAWLDSKAWWKIPLVGFLVGLTTNLHPVTGLFFAILLFSLTFITRDISWKSVITLIGTVLGILSGAYLITSNYISNTNKDIPNISVTFQEFAEVIQLKSRVFPYFPGSLWFIRYPLSGDDIIAIVQIYTACMFVFVVTALLLYYLHQQKKININLSKTLFVLLLIIQLPVVQTVTHLYALRFLVIIIAYTAYLVIFSQPRKIDWLLLIFMTLIIIYGFISNYFVKLIWLEFEIWSLVTFVSIQIRMVRLLGLPFYLYTAFFMNIIIQHNAFKSKWYRVGLVATLACFLLFDLNYLYTWVAILCALVLVQLYFDKFIQKSNIMLTVFHAIGFVLGLKAISLLINVPLDKWLLIYLVVPFFLFRLVHIYSKQHYQWHILLTTVACYIVLLSFYMYRQPNTDSWFNAWDVWSKIDRTSVVNLTRNARQEDDFELYTWAKNETDIDSLFYHHSPEFRFRAERSLIHSSKGDGVSAYSKELLIPLVKRSEKLNQGYHDKVLMLENAREYDVDYIVTELAHNPRVDLPIVFENRIYIVYDFRNEQ